MADRTVYFAKITRAGQVGLFDRSFGEDLLAVLDPHLEVERYNRTWRLSRPQLVDGFIVGKLGFVRTSQAPETRYDDQLEDFVTQATVASEGSFSMFVVDVAREIMAFEERPPAIRRQSFVGAFSKLLQAANFRATVTLLADPTEFQDFVRSVDRVQRIRTVIFEPNPGWREEARNFEEIIDQANAERAEIVVVAAPGEGLNPNAPWVEGALAQISEEGKGTLKATGFEGTHKRVWTFGARLQVAVITDDDAASPEGVWEWMKAKLRDIYRRE